MINIPSVIFTNKLSVFVEILMNFCIDKFLRENVQVAKKRSPHKVFHRGGQISF